ncbi:hypothetical protein ARMGADRAFT_1131645 [Armillaria gallica]|uniref:Uncharacterized protein n=1 Tax=Armillaria gallica TaxID=47427 RepID=A0A2H3CP41_ARMGA|nr:hypothetical protein ARMGADRAFT_1131645 [Armillaria gallica]
MSAENRTDIDNVGRPGLITLRSWRVNEKKEMLIPHVKGQKREMSGIGMLLCLPIERTQAISGLEVKVDALSSKCERSQNTLVLKGLFVTCSSTSLSDWQGRSYGQMKMSASAGLGTSRSMQGEDVDKFGVGVDAKVVQELVEDVWVRLEGREVF